MKTVSEKNINISRIKITIAIFLLVIFFIAGYLFKIMIINGEDLKRMSINQSFREVETESKRGGIYDRNGSPLAISLDAYSLAVDPLLARDDKDLHYKLKEISSITGIEEEKLVEAVNKQSRFVWIKRLLEDEETEKIREVRLKGALLFEESKRVYPKGQFLANVIGFVGQDNKGLEGIEYYYDSVLKGIPGKILVEEDSRGRSINSSVYQILPSQEGLDIYLTIDETIQYVTEKRLIEAIEELKADKGVAMVYDLQNGEFLSMANYPTYDPNIYSTFTNEHFRNIAINSLYEVGSTFKPFVASAAIEEAKIGRSEIINCESSIKVLNYNIREIIYPKSYGEQTIVQALQNSSNVGFVQIGQRVGKEDLYRYIKGFGLEGRTGIDLPGERTSNIIPERRATILDISVSSIGQGNALTPVQLIRGFAAIVNEGKLMKPYLLKEAKDSHGNVIMKNDPKVENVVISKETSEFMRNALKSVVDEGTGRRARIDGFSIAGKTGTAQKSSDQGGYLEDQVVTSFIGFAPSNNPRFVCLVMIDNPQTYKTGSQTAAPVFKDVIEKTLEYYDIVPEIMPEEAEAANILARKGENIKIVQKYHSMEIEKSEEIKSNPDNFVIKGNGSYILAQYPFEGEEIKEGQKIFIYLSDKEKNEIIVPDLTGMTILEAGRLLEQMGLIIKVNGSGYADSQLPSPETVIKKDSIVQVYFSNKNEGRIEDDKIKP